MRPLWRGARQRQCKWEAPQNVLAISYHSCALSVSVHVSGSATVSISVAVSVYITPARSVFSLYSALICPNHAGAFLYVSVSVSVSVSVFDVELQLLTAVPYADVWYRFFGRQMTKYMSSSGKMITSAVLGKSFWLNV